MTLPVILDPEAQHEYDESYDFYESCRVGLGERFDEAIHIVLDRIAVMPKLHRMVFGDVRMAVVQKFPYCVYYRIELEQVRVISIFHTSRNPRVWQTRSSAI